ncbi:MAG: hypothetical protein N2B06_16950 [Clostridium sp.]
MVYKYQDDINCICNIMLNYIQGVDARGETHCYCEIPQMFYGTPIFDVSKIVDKIIKILVVKRFNVKKTKNKHVLHIDWSTPNYTKDEIKQQKRDQGLEKMNFEDMIKKLNERNGT